MAAGADFHIGVNDGIGADLDAGAQPGFGMNDGRWMDHRDGTDSHRKTGIKTEFFPEQARDKSDNGRAGGRQPGGGFWAKTGGAVSERPAAACPMAGKRQVYPNHFCPAKRCGWAAPQPPPVMSFRPSTAFRRYAGFLVKFCQIDRFPCGLIAFHPFPNDFTNGFFMRHTISVLVENSSACSRAWPLFSGRGYNIDTLNVGPTRDPKLSRMTIVTHGDESTVEQDHQASSTSCDAIKCRCFAAGETVDPRAGAREGRGDSKTRRRGDADHGYFPRKNRDVQRKTLTVEITGSEKQVEKFLDLMKLVRRAGDHAARAWWPCRASNRPVFFQPKPQPHLCPKSTLTKTPISACSKTKTLAILGFGSQGTRTRSTSKDSGLKVIIGLYEAASPSRSRRKRVSRSSPTAEAVKLADVIMVALPDTKQAGRVQESIERT